MSFFDAAISEFRPEPEYVPQVWGAPPRGVVPGYSSQRAVIFRTTGSIFYVDRFLAYPTGIRFMVALLSRDPIEEVLLNTWQLSGRASNGRIPDEFLRFGILLSDGSKWTNLDHDYFDDDDPIGPVVVDQGFGGGGDTLSWATDYWMWPLPHEGPLTFVASWPAYKVSESTAVVDATEIRARAGDAEVLWPD